ncbi:MAG: hypothetical protein RSB24_08835, partial [Akkermansia sp.]
PCYVLASSKQVDRRGEKPDDFDNISDVSGVYEIKRVISYFPRTESDPGRAMQRLIHIEPARIVKESDESKFLRDFAFDQNISNQRYIDGYVLCNSFQAHK